MTSPGQKEEARRRDRDEEPEEKAAEVFDLSRFLHEKRWEVQEGPFRGFGSPPGRF